MKSVVRVLIVDDSGVYREFLSHLLSSDPRIEIAAAVSDGTAAVEAAASISPDVVVMDLNMPGMNGYDATRRIMESSPVPIIAVSAAGDIGEVKMSFQAMESGAVAMVPKPRGGDSPESAAQSRELILMVKLMAEVKVVRRWTRRAGQLSAAVPRLASTGCDAILIGASTGGPLPMRTILSALPVEIRVSVLVVQHIAPGFGAGFAEWLAGACLLPVTIALDGERVEPGHVYVAPDEAHMGVSEGPRIILNHDEPEHGLRPSVSHLFRSAARVYGKRAVGVLLSGMGKDGAAELKSLRDLGAVTLAQDQESCVVFGMPGEAIRLGGAQYTLTPEAIAAAVVSLAATREPGRGTLS